MDIGTARWIGIGIGSITNYALIVYHKHYDICFFMLIRPVLFMQTYFYPDVIIYAIIFYRERSNLCLSILIRCVGAAWPRAAPLREAPRPDPPLSRTNSNYYYHYQLTSRAIIIIIIKLLLLLSLLLLNCW